jgi:hypothetical protein
VGLIPYSVSHLCACLSYQLCCVVRLRWERMGKVVNRDSERPRTWTKVFSSLNNARTVHACCGIPPKSSSILKGFHFALTASTFSDLAKPKGAWSRDSLSTRCCSSPHRAEGSPQRMSGCKSHSFSRRSQKKLNASLRVQSRHARALSFHHFPPKSELAGSGDI